MQDLLTDIVMHFKDCRFSTVNLYNNLVVLVLLQPSSMLYYITGDIHFKVIFKDP